MATTKASSWTGNRGFPSLVPKLSLLETISPSPTGRFTSPAWLCAGSLRARGEPSRARLHQPRSLEVSFRRKDGFGRPGEGLLARPEPAGRCVVLMAGGAELTGRPGSDGGGDCCEPRQSILDESLDPGRTGPRGGTVFPQAACPMRTGPRRPGHLLPPRSWTHCGRAAQKEGRRTFPRTVEARASRSNLYGQKQLEKSD